MLDPLHSSSYTGCVQVQAGDFTAKKEIVALERRGVQEEGTGVLSFEFRKQLFEYSEASHTFSKLAFPVEVSARHVRYQDVHPVHLIRPRQIAESGLLAHALS